MADTAARIAISARRNEVARFTIAVTGIDMTGVAMAMQVRQTVDNPYLLFALGTVNTLAAEGLKLDSVIVTNGIPTSIIKGRINASTMTDATKVPYMGEIGADSRLAYAMQWTLNGDAQTRLYGDFVVIGSAFGSDNAPTNRPQSYGASSTYGGASSGSLAFGDQVVQVSIAGIEQVAALVGLARQQADRAAAQIPLAAAQVALAEIARDKAFDWAEGTGAPGAVGSKSSKAWAGDSALSAASSRIAALSSIAASETGSAIKEAILAAAADKPFAIAVGAGDVTFETLGVAKLAVIPATAKVIATRGRKTPGDGGQAGYRRVAADPSASNSLAAFYSFRSADRFMPDGSSNAANGGWWTYVLVNNTIYGPQFGAVGDYDSADFPGTPGQKATAIAAAISAGTLTDNYAPIMAALGFRASAVFNFSPNIKLATGKHYCSQSLTPRGQIDLNGANRGVFAAGLAGQTATWLVTPTDVANVVCRPNNNAQGIPGAHNSWFSDIFFTQVTKGTNLGAHAIDATCRVYLYRNSYISVAGDGEHIEAYTDGSTPVGEASGWVSVDCFAFDCGGDGHYDGGSDTNIGRLVGFHAHAIMGFSGIRSDAYFVNNYIGCHSSGYNPSGVSYQGRLWQPIGRFNTNSPPSQENRNWYDLGDAASPPAGYENAFPAWSSATTYRPKAPFVASGPANVQGLYVEAAGSGHKCHAPKGTVFGPDMGWTHYTAVMSPRGGALTVPTGVGYGRDINGNINDPAFPTIGSQEVGIIGWRDDNRTRDKLSALLYLQFKETFLLWDWERENSNLTFRKMNRKELFSLQFEGDGGYTGGGAAPVNNHFVLNGFLLKDRDVPTNARRVWLSNLPPTSGEHQAGDRVFNADPTGPEPYSASKNIDYWLCTQAGAIASEPWAAGQYPSIGEVRQSDGKAWVLKSYSGRGFSVTTQPPMGSGVFTDQTNGMVWQSYQQAFVFVAIYLNVTATITYDPPSIPPGGSVFVEVYPAAAPIGATVQSILSIDEGDVIVRARVSSTNIVRVRYQNPTGAAIDLPAHEIKVVVQNA